jgi:hypothetical protein
MMRGLPWEFNQPAKQLPASKFQFAVHKHNYSTHTVPIQPCSPIFRPAFGFSEYHFGHYPSILPACPMQHFTLTFPGHICIYTSHSSHPPWWNFPNNIRYTAYIMKFSLRHFLYPPASVSPNDGKNIFLRTSFSKYFISVVFLKKKDLVSH